MVDDILERADDAGVPALRHDQLHEAHTNWGNWADEPHVLRVDPHLIPRAVPVLYRELNQRHTQCTFPFTLVWLVNFILVMVCPVAGMSRMLLN